MKPVLADAALDHLILHLILTIRVRSVAGAVDSAKVVVVLVYIVQTIFLLFKEISNTVICMIFSLFLLH